VLSYLFGRNRFVVATLVALIATALSGGSAMGGVLISHSGKTGLFSLNDSSNFSPAECIYGQQDNPILDKIALHSITVWARDRTSAIHEYQRVGLEMKIKKRTLGTSKWTLFGIANVVKADAWDDQSATWPSVPVFEIDANYPTDSVYRVVVKMIWYKPDGNTVAGTATARYSWITRIQGATETVARGCPGHI
jgi:hypothetical protein